MKSILRTKEEDNTQSTGSAGSAAGDVANANQSPPEGTKAAEEQQEHQEEEEEQQQESTKGEAA